MCDAEPIRQMYYFVWQQTWWRHQMETTFTLLAICAENSPVTGEFPTQRPVMRIFDVLLDLRLNNRLSNSGEARDLRRHRVHYEVSIMRLPHSPK